MPDRPILRLMSMLLPAILLAGCDSDDARLVKLAQESTSRQAKQNQVMARQNQEAARATQQLIEADAQSRQEILQLQASLQEDAQTQRASLDRQHEDLERERRQIAAVRHRDPLIAGSILNATALLACLAPLLLGWFVLRSLGHQPAESELGELLVQELVAEKPLLLPASFVYPPAIEQEPALPTGSPPSVSPGETVAFALEPVHSNQIGESA